MRMAERGKGWRSCELAVRVTTARRSAVTQVTTLCAAAWPEANTTRLAKAVSQVTDGTAVIFGTPVRFKKSFCLWWCCGREACSQRVCLEAHSASYLVGLAMGVGCTVPW